MSYQVVVRILALLLLPLMASSARADTAEYAKLLRDGVQEFGLGNYGEARLLFSRAHEITPTARTFRGLGLCDFELRHYVGAITELESALTDQRRPLTAELRSQVEPILERARQYVGRYKLQVPAGVRSVSVDGRSQPLPADGELLLDPGPHTIEIKPEGFATVSRDLNVQVGAREALALMPESATAVAVTETPEPEPQPLAEPEPAPLPPPAAVSQSRVYTWVAVGLTGAFGAGILGFGLSAKGKNDDFRAQAALGSIPDPQLKSSGQTFETLTNISIVGCALSAAAAVTLFFVEGANSGTEAPPAVQAGLTPTGAFVQGRF
jgi:hypothetical protein